MSVVVFRLPRNFVCYCSRTVNSSHGPLREPFFIITLKYCRCLLVSQSVYVINEPPTPPALYRHIHTPTQADQPSGRSVSPEVVEGGWLTGWLVICMAVEFKRSYRCRNPHTAEWTLFLTQMLRLGLFLLFKYMWISGSSDIFLLSQEIWRCSVASIWRTHSCLVGFISWARDKGSRTYAKTFIMETLAPAGNWTKHAVCNVIGDTCAVPPVGVRSYWHHLGHMETLYRYCSFDLYYSFISLKHVWWLI